MFYSPLHAPPWPPQGYPHPSKALRAGMLTLSLLTRSLNIPKRCFPAAWGTEVTRPVAVCQCLPTVPGQK